MRSSFDLITSESEISFNFVPQPDGFDVSWHTDGKSVVWGLATAISEDGYILTAAHLIKQHCYVIGWLDRGIALVPVRLVAKEISTEFGGEIAVLHVTERPARWQEPGDLDAADQRIYCLAKEDEPERHNVILAGRVLGNSRPPAGARLTVLATTLPTWRGDSGGGVYSPQGRLVGVVTGVTKPWFSSTISKLVSVPERAFLQTTIDADRTDRHKVQLNAATNESR